MRTLKLALLAITLLVVGSSSFITIRSAERTESMVAQPMAELEELRNFDAFGSEVAQTIKDLYDVTEGLEERADVETSLRRARAALDRIRSTTTAAGDAAGAAMLGELQDVFDGITRLRGQVDGLMRAGRLGEAHALVREVSEDLYEDRFRGLLQRAGEHEANEARQMVAAAGTRAQATANQSLLLVLLGAVAIGLAGWEVLRSHRRLSRFMGVVARMRDGDLHARAADQSRDEVGELARAFDAMSDNVEQLLSSKVEKDQLRQEMALAARLQRSLLPPELASGALEVSGAMRTASNVGGDYYDVQLTDDGGWIAIGDVSGHGFDAGIIMLMVQSAIAAAVHSRPDAGPAEVLTTVNRVMYDSVKNRLELREHVTLSLLRYWNDGRVAYAGAHQDMLVRRADGDVRVIPTEGTWLALVRDLGAFAIERELRLAPGESLVLFTDGLTEARTHRDELFGIDRLRIALAAASDGGDARQVCDQVMQTIQDEVVGFDDDATLVVVRRPARTLASCEPQARCA